MGVAREILILGQFDLGDRARIAFVFFGRLLHGGGKVEHIVEVGLDVVLVADLPAAGAGVPGDQPVPIHGQDLLHALLLIRQVGVRHDAELGARQRQEVDDEDDLLLRQAHDERIVAVVLAEIEEFERRAAELQLAAVIVNHEIRNDDIRRLAALQERLRVLVGNEDGAQVLERLAARNMVVVAVAVHDVLDRRLGDLADFRDIGRRGRPPLSDRVGGYHAVGRDDEHRLVALIAENVDAIGALDLGGREQRRRRGLRAGRQRRGSQYTCEQRSR